MSYIEILSSTLRSSIAAKNTFLESIDDVYEIAIGKIIESYKKGGRLYIAGNGGSAADAQHLAAEFVCKFSKPRAPIPAEALSTDTSLITAIGNDFGYKYIFSRQVEGKITSNDVFLAISTSGNSENIIEALKVTKDKNICSILLSGKDGGEAKGLADYSLIVPSDVTSTIQELHICVYHSLCVAVEKALFSDL